MDWRMFTWKFQKVIGNYSELASVIGKKQYMERLVKEYMDLLDGVENASDKFWKLEERIKKDKKHPGVRLELNKGNMIFDIVTLINSGVITTADVADFSDELKESVDFILRR